MRHGVSEYMCCGHSIEKAIDIIDKNTTTTTITTTTTTTTTNNNRVSLMYSL